MKNLTIFVVLVAMLVAGCSSPSPEPSPSSINPTEGVWATSTRPEILPGDEQTMKAPTRDGPKLSKQPPISDDPEAIPVKSTLETTSTLETSPVTGTSTPIITPDEVQFKNDCVVIQRYPSDTAKFSGKIILSGYQHPSYLLDLSSGEQSLLRKDSKESYAEFVSPDGRWLAYVISSPDQIIVNSLIDERTPLIIPWEENWFWLEGWLNEQNLHISIEGGGDILINPFSQERVSLFTDFPDLAVPVGAGADWWPEQYNSTLTRAVYPQQESKDGGRRVVLWDLLSNERIAAFYDDIGFSGYGVQPIWSPDGDEFIMSLYREDQKGRYTELNQISQNGDVKRVINLRSIFPEGWLSIREYRWSPDATKVAFWLEAANGDEYKTQLVIIDMKSYDVTNYCIVDQWSINRDLVWSPNGNQIVVNSVLDDQAVVVLLDLENQTAYYITSDLTAVGWLKDSP